MINNQKFSHCIKYQDGYCDVSFTSSTFDWHQWRCGRFSHNWIKCTDWKCLWYKWNGEFEFYRSVRVPCVLGRLEHSNARGLRDLIPPPALLKPDHLRTC